MMMNKNINEHLTRFISLGDNCEFGFFQRECSVESGALLRWAITQPDALSKSINSGFEGIYEFENLSPSSRDMVLDSGTGIFFHTQMFSVNGDFILPEAARRAIYIDEKRKIDYLTSKLMESFKRQNIYIYKKNSGLSFSSIKAIADAIASRGPGKLLVVTDQGVFPPGSAQHIYNNIYIARIDRFAPYNKADDISSDIWRKIVTTADKLIPH